MNTSIKITTILQKELADAKEWLRVKQAVYEVMKKWNGKKINKRILDDILKATGYLNGSYQKEFSVQVNLYSHPQSTDTIKNLYLGSTVNCGQSNWAGCVNADDWVGDSLLGMEEKITLLEKMLLDVEKIAAIIDNVNGAWEEWATCPVAHCLENLVCVKENYNFSKVD